MYLKGTDELGETVKRANESISINRVVEASQNQPIRKRDERNLRETG